MQYAEVGPRRPPASERWRSPAFRAELTTWLLSEVGEPTSLVPVKVRPWATVWRASTASGVFVAKQNCAAQGYEARLLVTLNDLAARHVVPLAAADPGRGLLLTPDQGPVLAETLADPGDIDAWCRIVAAGAQLQLEVARYADHLVDAGLTVLAPSEAPAYVARRLDELGALPIGDPRAATREQADAVRAVLPDVSRWADDVAALGLPLTLCHNGLHADNAVEHGGELRFFDFADAVVAEPLAALLVPLHLLRARFHAAPDDPRLRRVADAALEVWTDHASAADLRAALPAALQLGRLARTEAWLRCVAATTDAELAEWGDRPARWLASLADAPPVTA